MIRKCSLSAFALVVTFVLGLLVSHSLPVANAQPAGGRGKCVGVAVAPANGQGVFAVYRAYEDGTIERTDNTNDTDLNPSWRKVGK